MVAFIALARTWTNPAVAAANRGLKPRSFEYHSMVKLVVPRTQPNRLKPNKAIGMDGVSLTAFSRVM